MRVCLLFIPDLPFEEVTYYHELSSIKEDAEPF